MFLRGNACIDLSCISHLSGSKSVPSGSKFERSGGACLSPTYTSGWLFSKSRHLAILSDSIKPWPMTGWGCFKYPSCGHAQSEDTWAICTKHSFILGATVPGEAPETMVLCWWQSIVHLRKLAIYCNYIWNILRTMDYYALGLQKREKRKNVKPTSCNPLQKS